MHSGPALGRGEDGATTAMLIDMVFFLAIATANWHSTRHHRQQALAARQAANHLHAAYTAAAAQSMTVLRQRGHRLTPWVRQRQANLVRQVLPEFAGQVEAEAGWPVLATTLDDAQRAGHDPAALLTDAVRRRELGTATSISEVLVWRLRRSAHLIALPESPNAPDTRDSRRTPPATTTRTTTSALRDSSRRP